MGCDIHIHVEQQDDSGTWVHVDWPHPDREEYIYGPFDWQSYGMFAFLGYDGRNYSRVPSLAPLRGLPPDASATTREDADKWGADGHGHSWLTTAELTDFDYSATFEDRRVTIDGNGGVTAEPGGGRVVTFREFLGEQFVDDMEALTAMNSVRPTRVVFWFDN